MKKIEEKVILHIRKNSLIKEGDKILAGFSGGADSLFMLFFLNKIAAKYRIEMSAFHLNHSLRGNESDGDEQFCREFCDKNGIKLYIEKIDINKYSKENKLSIEEAARIIRYNLFTNYASVAGANKVATAHNKSDSVETVVFNFFRGTGLAGLKGIPVQRENIIRPVLCLTKEEIRSYLAKNKLEFRLDSSNLSNDYTRNYIRNILLPDIKKNLNQSVEDSIEKFSFRMNSLSLFAEKMKDDLYQRFISLNSNSIKIALELFVEPNSLLAGEVLKRVFEEIINYEYSFSDYAKIESLAGKNTGKSEQLKQNYIALRERDYIEIFEEDGTDYQKIADFLPGETLEFESIKISSEIIDSVQYKESDRNSMFFDASKVTGKLTVRYWKDGDKFIPAGLNKHKKVSDFLQEQKVDIRSKRKQIVICNGEDIVIVAGLRINDKYRVKKETERIIKLRIIK